ncbi:MAG: ABC transporter substrate-binding protein [Lutispora sp.]|nr:ABC transporter substrate-binding protein [Lutispora sp.]
MKRKLTLIMVVVLVIGLIMVGCSSLGSKAANSGTENSDNGNKLPLSGRHFVIGVNAECAPYESIDAKGNFVGFDIDFADALSKKLGFTHEWKDMEFFGLIGEVQGKKIDMVISCLSGTEERKKKVDFSTGYNYSISCIISKPGSGIETVDDLKGKKVGAAAGSNFEALIKAVPGTKLISYDSTVPAVSIVGTPELDALIELSTFGEHYAAPAGLEAHVIPKTIAEELAGERPLAIAFPKGSDLVPIFDQAIAELEEEGVMNEICAKWLGQDYVDKLPIFYEKE